MSPDIVTVQVLSSQQHHGDAMGTVSLPFLGDIIPQWYHGSLAFYGLSTLSFLMAPKPLVLGLGRSCIS